MIVPRDPHVRSEQRETTRAARQALGDDGQSGSLLRGQQTRDNSFRSSRHPCKLSACISNIRGAEPWRSRGTGGKARRFSRRGCAHRAARALLTALEC
jgi:hypothetical protein